MSPKAVWNFLLASPALLTVSLAATSALAADVSGLNESSESLLQNVTASPDATFAPTAAVAPATVAPAETASTHTQAASLPQAPVQMAQVSDLAQPASVAQSAATAQPASAADGGASLDQITQYSQEGSGDSQSQVTSISQLSDVQPTDWAFQALQSLVERYGVIAGYPDGTFRGNRAMTRYEFAAGLNAALDRVNELIASGLANAVTREDLATLQRLQEEFSAELATLRGRVDNLEARTAELEANQFSTTTKLQGRTIFFISTPGTEDNRFNDQTVFAYRVRLNFDTSFTGKDRLRARLQARNIQNFAGDSVGFRAAGNSSGNFEVDNLFYTFPLGDRLTINLAANGLEASEVVDSVITRFEDNDLGAINALGRPPQYTQAASNNGAGASLTYRLINTDNFRLNISGGYIGGNGTFGGSTNNAGNPNEKFGLFNGNYSAVGQVTFLSSFVDVGLTYINSYSKSAFNPSGIYGGLSGPVVANTYGGQVNFKLFDDRVEIGGGIAYSNVQGIGSRPDYELWSYQGTVAFPDFLGEGNLLGFIGGVAPYTRDVGTTGNTNPFGEAFFLYRLNDNIAITPSIIVESQPFNNAGNDFTVIGTLRTTFLF
jgi:hypothetical protein